MSLFSRSIIVIAAAGALSIPVSPSLSASDGNGTVRRRPVVNQTAPRTPKAADFAVDQLEHYLTDDGVAFIRPGFNIKVNSVMIGSNGKPVVDLNIMDDMNQPLDRAGELTPGSISMTLMMAWWNTETREYVSYHVRNVGGGYTQADRDRTGTWTALETGHYLYNFGTALTGMDPSATHTLGIYGNRDLRDFVDELRYFENVEYDFRPDGGTVGDQTWDKINDTTSCLNCHDPLAIHGGQRRDVKLCVLCHTSQTTDPDTGNSVDFELMIHKIHRGAELENGYTIIGFGGSVHDYSEVHFPQDHRNCQNCHVGSNANQAPSQSNNYYTFPSRKACGACHDHVDFATGEGHVAGMQADDSACANCHVPESEVEFDASILGAHTIPVKSKQLEGVNVEIVSATNMAPGMTPTVVIKVTNDKGAILDPATFTNSFHPILAGPTTSYKYYFREDARSTLVFDAVAGTSTYTFTNMIPEGASGTWVISGDFRRSVTILDGQGMDVSVTEAGMNPIKYFSIDGKSVKPRRTVVTINQCNSCHDVLAFHGGQRLLTDECVICHNPVTTDHEVRPGDAGEPASVSFQRLIHRIHSGHELLSDYTIYGYRSSKHNYNEVLYPGDRRNCAKCHTGGSEQIPAPLGVDPVITPRDFFSPQAPSTAACLGCHDTQDAAAHAYINTTTFPGSDTPRESCGVCHGSGADWSVSRVHAR